MLNRILIFVLLFWWSLPLNAQTPQTLPTTIDKSSILEGEHITYTLKLPKTLSPKLFPKWKDSLGKFEIVEYLGVDTLTDGYLQKVVITAFDSGTWKIPVLNIDSGRYKSDTLSVYCNNVPVDTSKAFKPVYGYREVDTPIASWMWVWIGLAIAVVLAYIITGIYFYLRRKKKGALTPTTTYTPYEKAIIELDKIESSKAWEDEDNLKEYYVQITDIMRKYFHDEYQVNAMESTSSELLQRIKKVTKLQQKRKEIADVLEKADLAKFAKTRPNADENIASLHQVRLIIQWAKPKEEPVEESKPKKK